MSGPAEEFENSRALSWPRFTDDAGTDDLRIGAGTNLQIDVDDSRLQWPVTVLRFDFDAEPGVIRVEVKDLPPGGAIHITRADDGDVDVTVDRPDVGDNVRLDTFEVPT